MLGNLKENDTLYILDKRKRPTLMQGIVVEIKPPKTQFGQPAMPGNNFLPTFSDMSVRVNGEVMNLQQVALDKNLMDNGGGWVISNDRDAMCAYVHDMRQTSAMRLQNREIDEQTVEACDEIMPQLNPTMAKERERDKQIDERFSRLEGMMQRLLERELKSQE